MTLMFNVYRPWVARGAEVWDASGRLVATCVSPDHARLIAQAPLMYAYITDPLAVDASKYRVLDLAAGSATIPDGR